MSELEIITKPILTRLYSSVRQTLLSCKMSTSEEQENAILREFNKKLETQHYQMMEFAIFYTLTKMNYNFFSSSEEKIKKRVLEIMDQTKKFFNTPQSKQFSAFNEKSCKSFANTGKLSKMKVKMDLRILKMKDKRRQKSLIWMQKRLNYRMYQKCLNLQKLYKKVVSSEHNSIISEMLKKINQRDNVIRELEDKVKVREDLLNQAVAGHLKDVVHLRETIYRQSDLDSFEFFEVNYFDSTQLLDENARGLLNAKVLSLKQQFEMKSRDFLQKIILFTNENKQLKEKIRVLTIQIKEEFTLEKLLRKAFFCEANPYRIWKAIQDIKGTSLYFFEVFENQRPSEGINYREINKMMMSSKAYEREYQHLKLQLEEQTNKFIEQSRMQAGELVYSTEQKKQQIQLEGIENAKEFEQMKHQYEEKILSLNEENKKLKNSIVAFESKLGSKSDAVKYMLKRWIMVYRFYKHCQKVDQDANNYKKQIKKLICETTLVNQMKDFYEKKLRESKETANLLQSELDAIIVQNMNLNIKMQAIDEKHLQHQERIQILQAQIDRIEKEKSQLQQNKNIYENGYNNLLKQIMHKFVKPEQLIFQNEANHYLEEFKQKANNLDIISIRAAQETSELVSKNLDLTKIQDPKNHVLTQTEIYNVDVELIALHNWQKQLEEAKEYMQNNSIKRKSKAIDLVSSKENEYEQFHKFQKRRNNMQSKQTQTQKLPDGNQNQNNLSTLYKPVTRNKRFQSQIPSEENSDRQILSKISQTVTIQRDRKFDDIQKKTISFRDTNIFNRLFEDSKSKQMRLKEMVEKAQNVEQSHWEEILSLLNHLQGDQQQQQLKIANSIRFYKSQLEQTKHKQKPSRTPRELTDEFFSSILDTMTSKRRVFLKDFIDEFEKYTLRIQKVPLQCGMVDICSKDVCLRQDGHMNTSIELERKRKQFQLFEPMRRTFRRQFL